MATTSNGKAPTWPMTVEINISVFRVSEIKDTEETFACRFALHMLWVDPFYQGTEVAFSNHPEISTEICDAFPEQQMSVEGRMIPTANRPRWTPEIKFFNNSTHPELTHEYFKTDPASGAVKYYAEYEGIFDERFELHEFPFDSQLLTINVGTQHYGDRLKFVPGPRQNVMLGGNMSEWHFCSGREDGMPAVFAQMTYDPKQEDLPTHPRVHFVTLEHASKGGAHSVDFQIRASRLNGWYLVNVFWVLCAIGAVPAFLPVAGFGFSDRADLLMVIVLTFAVYKTWIATYLPKITYLTKMDLYLLMSVGFTCVWWLGQSTISSILCDADDPSALCRIIDGSMAGVYLLIWLIGHVFVWRKFSNHKRGLSKDGWERVRLLQLASKDKDIDKAITRSEEKMRQRAARSDTSAARKSPFEA